jgi:dienelactone hydrolase
MSQRRSGLGTAGLCLVVSVLLVGCAGAGPIFVTVSYTPNPLDASPLAAPPATTLPEMTTAPPLAAALPPTRTAAPPAETVAPPTETAVPPAETVAPPVETAAPSMETAAPPAETVATPAERRTPPAETEAPFGTPATAYDLGDFTIPQPGNPAGDMPARLNGLMALPRGSGPHPVALILHGAGFGCPPADGTRTSWPCGEAEQPNWTGFSYLASALADRGYLVLVPDVNAQYEVAYGEAKAFDRLAAVVGAHLERLAAAAAGREAGFGVDLTGVPDLERIVMAGHGLGADGALALAAPAGRVAQPGRVSAKALLLIAPDLQPRSTQSPQSELEPVSVSSVVTETESLPDVPIGVILPECDGIVPELAGARVYEAARLAEDRSSLTAQVFLSGASHNGFNLFFEVDDGEAIAGERSGCEPEVRLSSEAQRKFLARYAADFFDVALGRPGAERAAAQSGLDPAQPEPAFLYWQAAQTSLSVPADRRLRIVVPSSVAEVRTNLQDGPAQIVPPAEVTFCPGDLAEKSICGPGFHPAGGAPFPDTLRLAWGGRNALYQLKLPAEASNLTRYAALGLRAAVDPADARNWSGSGTLALHFSVILRDTAGRAAVVTVPAGIPALAFPAGELRARGDTSLWTGFTPLSSVRIPLSAFEGIDLSRVAGLAFSSGDSESGAIRIADLEFVAQ